MWSLNLYHWPIYHGKLVRVYIHIFGLIKLWSTQFLLFAIVMMDAISMISVLVSLFECGFLVFVFE